MAKKFWEREDFDIALFTSVFYGVNTLCNECVNMSDSKTFDAHLQDGEAMMYNEELAPLVKAFSDYRYNDTFTRSELAAFAITYGMFWSWNKQKEE